VLSYLQSSLSSIVIMVNEIDFVKATTRRGKTHYVQKLHQKSPRKKRTPELRPASPMSPLASGSHMPNCTNSHGHSRPVSPFVLSKKRRSGKVSHIHSWFCDLLINCCRLKMNTLRNGNNTKINTFSSSFKGRVLQQRSCVPFVQRRRGIFNVKTVLGNASFVVNAVSNIIARHPFIVFVVGSSIITKRSHSMTWASYCISAMMEHTALLPLRATRIR
jgi:hypothetical protein